MDYVITNRKSAEEQLFHSSRELFLASPSSVLQDIEKRKPSDREYLLGMISYGLLSFSPDDSVKITETSSVVFCRKILFQKYPQLKSLYPRHRKSIDSIIAKTKEDL
jgi:hypothetical protein